MITNSVTKNLQEEFHATALTCDFASTHAI
jgi:hypothetical protein